MQTGQSVLTSPAAHCSVQMQAGSGSGIASVCGVPLTPDGQATVLDNATNEDGKEFYTIQTPDENVFYLIIDNQRDTENVYFLNAVTESDLMALAVKEDDAPQTDAIPAPEPAWR
mgnify:CR=1 FL=1